MTFPVNPVHATPEQVHAARLRPPEARTPMPVAGQEVWYRHDAGGPLEAVKVESVDISNPRDWNVWEYVLDKDRRPVEVAGQRQIRMVPDPWPDVYLRTAHGRIVCRESRIEGSPGWLPFR